MISWTPEIEKKLSEWLIRWIIYTGETWIIHSKRTYAKVTIISSKGNRALVLFRRSSQKGKKDGIGGIWTAMDVRRDGVWKKDGWRRDGEPFFKSVPSFKSIKPINAVVYKNIIYSDPPKLVFNPSPKCSLNQFHLLSQLNRTNAPYRQLQIWNYNHLRYGTFIRFRISKPQPKSFRMLRFIEEKEDL